MKTRHRVTATLFAGLLPVLAAPLDSQQIPPTAASTAPAGQTPRTLILSLDDALRIAVGESENILVAEAGVMRAMGSETIARSQLFPQVSATAAYTRTLRSQFSGIDFGGTGGSPNAPGEPGAPDDSGISDLPFGQENQYSLGLSISQILFNGGQTRARIRAAEAQVRSSEIGSQSALAQTLLDVTQAYFDAQLSDRLVQIAEASLSQTEEVLRQTQVARQVGDRSEFELLRARVARDNQLPALIRQRTQRGEAYLRLKQLLNVPYEDNLQLTTGVEEPEPSTRFARFDRFEADAGPAPDDRAPVRQAAENVAASAAQLDEARGQRWPTVALSSSFAPVAFPADGIPEFDDFREDWSVTLSLSVPLLTWGRQAGTERVAEGSLSEARTRLRQLREAAALDTQVARNDLADAQATLAANTSTSQEAQRAYSIAQLRFREGIASQIELADSRLLLEQAEVNRALALRDVQVSRARLSLLEYLPLNQGFGSSGGGVSPQPSTPQSQPSQQTVTASTVGSSLGGLGGGSNVVNSGSPIP